VSRSQQPHKRFLMRLYWSNSRIQPKTSNEALNGMLRKADGSPVSRSPVGRSMYPASSSAGIPSTRRFQSEHGALLLNSGVALLPAAAQSNNADLFEH
jgi:hypothetical protein